MTSVWEEWKPSNVIRAGARYTRAGGVAVRLMWQQRLGDPFLRPEEMDPRGTGTIAFEPQLSADRLLQGFRQGVLYGRRFSGGHFWSCPVVRSALFVESLRISRKDRPRVRSRGGYRITCDRALDAVVDRCREPYQGRRSYSFINDDLIAAYKELAIRGHTHSVEVWNDQDELVGGLFGISVGRVFCPESMFNRSPNASKIGFICLVRHLEAWGYRVVDCNYPRPFFERHGAVAMSRGAYLDAIASLAHEPVQHEWKFDDHLDLLTPVGTNERKSPRSSRGLESSRQAG